MKKITSFVIALLLVFVSLTFTACGDESERSFPAQGVDLSSWQKEVDFSKLKKQGISFVILRAGTSKGKDSRFDKYYREAKSAGLDIGCYFFTYSLDKESAEQDARMLLKWIGRKKFQYPIYYDVEDDSMLDISVSERTEICESFRKVMEEKKFLVGLYTNANWLSYHLDMDSLSENFELWMAKWTNSGKNDADLSDVCRVWQYTEKGSVEGVSGNVDLDVCYYDYPGLVERKGYNNHHKKSDVTEALQIGEIWKTSGTEDTAFLTAPNGTKIGTVEKEDEICVFSKKTVDGELWGKTVVKGVKGWMKLDDATASSKASIFLLSQGDCRIDEQNRKIYGLDGSVENMLENVYASNLGIKFDSEAQTKKIGFVYDGFVFEEFMLS